MEMRPTHPAVLDHRANAWNLPSVIISMMALTVSDCLQLTTLGVITVLDGFIEHPWRRAPPEHGARCVRAPTGMPFDAALVHHQHGADSSVRSRILIAADSLTSGSTLWI